MILISHRGNINGKVPPRQNTIEYILQAINKGYNVQIDLWTVDNKFKLGHDSPIYDVSKDFLIQNIHHLWIHCKNIQTLDKMVLIKKSFDNVKFFFHNTDDATLTSNNYIWTYPGKYLGLWAIAVLPQITQNPPFWWCYVCGICSDYIEKYKDLRK